MHYRCSRALLLILFALIPGLAFAEKPVVGQALSPLSIEKYGEFVLDTERDEVIFAPWSTASFQSSPQMHAVMYIPAKFSATSSNVPYTEMLESPEIAGRAPYIRATTILSIDENGWGGPEMVLGSIRYNKRKRPHATLVADSNGQGALAWELAKDDPTTIMVLDQHGTVQFFNAGELTAAQVEEVARLLIEGTDAIMNAAPATTADTGTAADAS